jgi:hypothetical protein
MQPNIPAATATLPFAGPTDASRRLLLYCLRRMGAHGLHDAHAANAMLGTFGLSYQRPLVMLRAFVAETTRTSHRKIRIAGCCCFRMTLDEARLIDAITSSETDIRNAAIQLRTVLGTPDSLGALGAAQAVQAAFADLGHPLGLD